MGGYRSDDEALVGLARQLADAYGEARKREDQDYACDAIAEYLAEYREVAPSEALLALLDLPLTVETYPLVDEVQLALAARGAAAVRQLVAAALGDVYDSGGEAPQRAAEALEQMDTRELLLGLLAVLRSRGDDRLKGEAADRLVALGSLAEPDLVATLDDAHGGDWAEAALEQLRFERERQSPDEGRGAETPDDTGGLHRGGLHSQPADGSSEDLMRRFQQESRQESNDDSSVP